LPTRGSSDLVTAEPGRLQGEGHPAGRMGPVAGPLAGLVAGLVEVAGFVAAPGTPARHWPCPGGLVQSRRRAGAYPAHVTTHGAERYPRSVRCPVILRHTPQVRRGTPRHPAAPRDFAVPDLWVPGPRRCKGRTVLLGTVLPRSTVLIVRHLRLDCPHGAGSKARPCVRPRRRLAGVGGVRRRPPPPGHARGRQWPPPAGQDLPAQRPGRGDRRLLLRGGRGHRAGVAADVRSGPGRLLPGPRRLLLPELGRGPGSPAGGRSR